MYGSSCKALSAFVSSFQQWSQKTEKRDLVHELSLREIVKIRDYWALLSVSVGVVGPRTMYLDPDPEFWPNLDPDPKVSMLYILNFKVFVWWIVVFIKLSFFLFLPVWNRIRIRNTDPDPQSCWMYGSNKDPDPKSSWIRIQLWSGSQKLLNTDPMRIRIHTVAEYGSYSIWSTCTEGRPPPPPARPGSPCHCSPPPALQQRENVTYTVYLFIWTGGAVLYSCFSGG